MTAMVEPLTVPPKVSSVGFWMSWVVPVNNPFLIS